MLSDILGMLTAQTHELEEEILPSQEEIELMEKYGDIEG